MFEVGVADQFEAAHRLRGDFGPATRMHGHTYRVEVTVQGSDLGANGALFDISILNDALRDTVGELHFRDLSDVEGLEGRNTTAEVVARYVFERMARAVGGGGLQSMTVRVWESPKAWAAYEARL